MSAEDERTVETEAGAGAAGAASELVVHGLLETLHARDAVAGEARIARVMSAVERDAARSVLRRIWPATRWGLAAVVVVAAAAVLLRTGLPSEAPALAAVRGAIQAERGAPDVRYEVRVLSWADEDEPADPVAVVDRGPGGLLVVGHRPPPRREEMAYVGRDAEGEWAIARDGSVVRGRVRMFWPPWSVDDEFPIVDSLDRVLAQLTARYVLERAGRGGIAGGDAKFDRIVATRADREGPIPHRVELWIDPETRLTERVEMTWERGPGPDAEGRAGPGPDRPGPDGPGRGGPGPGRPGPPHRPPRLIVIQRVAQPALPEDWYTAAAHARE